MPLTCVCPRVRVKQDNRTRRERDEGGCLLAGMKEAKATIKACDIAHSALTVVTSLLFLYSIRPVVAASSSGSSFSPLLRQPSQRAQTKELSGDLRTVPVMSNGVQSRHATQGQWKRKACGSLRYSGSTCRSGALTSSYSGPCQCCFCPSQGAGAKGAVSCT